MHPVWDEIGLADGTLEERAETWRQWLLDDLDDFRTGGGLSVAFIPLIPDLTEEARIAAYALFGMQSINGKVRYEDINVDAFIELLEEQIQNASKQQMVQYAEKHYDRS